MTFLRKRERALISISLLLLGVAACRSQTEPVATDSSTDTVVSSTPPFQTKEPDRYRAVRTITTVTAAGETTITKTSVARSGETRRTEFTTGSKTLIYIDGPLGRFVLLLDERVCAEVAAGAGPLLNADDASEISPERLLHTDTGETSYQKLGAESIGGRNTTRYRIVVNSLTAANVTVSETLMWIDDELKMPIKSETKSPDGTRVTMELSDITLDVDGRVFQIPEDCKKIGFEELRGRLN